MPEGICAARGKGGENPKLIVLGTLEKAKYHVECVRKVNETNYSGC